MMSLPSHTQVAYETPSLPVLLSLSAYLYLLSFTSSLSPLLGPLLTGILLGPSLAGLLTPALQQTLIDIGYIGLLLIVFEAGLSTHPPLLIGNAGISCAAALTGILLPIALSMALLKGAYGYGGLQAFAAGAALCSTSLGTTLALLTPKLRRTRVGSVLMCAALLDDVVGLVVAGIIPGLADAESGVQWETIVRPVLVSVAFAVGTPALAWALRKVIRMNWGRLRPWKTQTRAHMTRRSVRELLYDTRAQLFFIVATLSAFVAGTKYAGTSELFGAYLAGAFLAYIFTESLPPPSQTAPSSAESEPPSTSTAICLNLDDDDDAGEPHNAPLESFNTHLLPILTPLLGPIFFASIGAALPIGALFTIRNTGGGNEHRVVWRGIVYSVLMVLAKMVVGVWMLVWPEPKTGRGRGRVRDGGGVGGVGVMGRVRVWIVGSKRRRWWDLGLGRRNGGREVEEGVMVPVIAGSGPPPLAKSGLDSKTNAGAGVGVAVGGAAEHGASPGAGQRQPDTLGAAEQGGCAPNSNPKAPELQRERKREERKRNGTANPDEPTRKRAAALLGLAMVARGEIALIVAQLARPLLVGFGATGSGSEGEGSMDDGGAEEPFAVVIWAILVSTVGGALGVGVLLGSWKRRDRDGG